MTPSAPYYGPNQAYLAMDYSQQPSSNPPNKMQSPLQAKNCCSRYFLTTRLLITLCVAVALVILGAFMFLIPQNKYPGQWTKATCTLPSADIVPQPARFYNPCKHGFTCNLCKIQHSMLTFKSPVSTTNAEISTDVELIAKDISESSCISVNDDREFKCIYQTRIVRKLRTPTPTPINTQPSHTQTGIADVPRPTIDPDNLNLFHYDGFDLELYPYSHYHLDHDTYIGQQAAATGVILIGAFILIIYLILVLMRWLQATFYSCRFCSVRYCFTWCIFTCIFPKEKSKLKQNGETDQLWKGLRGPDVVVLDDPSNLSRHREGELHILDTSSDSDSDLLADHTDKIVGANKMNIPRPNQPNPSQLPGGLQPFSFQSQPGFHTGASTAGSLYTSSMLHQSAANAPGSVYNSSIHQNGTQQTGNI